MLQNGQAAGQRGERIIYRFVCRRLVAAVLAVFFRLTFFSPEAQQCILQRVTDIELMLAGA
jgi:hypothetical protein